MDKGWLAITDFYYRKKDYKKALYYINKAINIDGENSVYWKKSAKINKALENYDEADFAYKQAVDLGNFELETWLSWTEVVLQLDDAESAFQILQQGLEFYPEEAKLWYAVTGVHLLLKKTAKAKISFSKAIKLDLDTLSTFKAKFPQFYPLGWIQDIISEIKRAS
ncbi:MAG: tetratricopeptide (TPR) repeat protein [Sediminicola sp.]